MTDQTCSTSQPCSRALNFALLLALVGGLLVTVFLEWPRLQFASETGQWGSLLLNFHYDSTLPMLLFLALPICWFYRGRSHDAEQKLDAQRGQSHRSRDILTAIVLAALSVCMSHHVASRKVDGQRFGDLPFAYHDEYSYRLQTETYLDGRLSYAVHPTHPELFTQFHVVNEDRFASRYFPATGLVIAPFLASGHVYWGHWLCGALTTIFIFLTGQELGSYKTGLFAGLFCALSPAMALFSNLLLAHHPTLLGLSAFLFFYLRMWRTKSVTSGFLAGVGLTFATLSRPMAAAGFALPMGVLLLASLIKPYEWLGNQSVLRKTAFKFNLAVGLPVLLGLLVMLPINKAITGDALQLPYSQFQETYTPEHAYGFNNVERGTDQRQKETFARYDDWAENLTPESARQKSVTRLTASLRWTWGIVPLTMVGLFCLTLGVEKRNPWSLILASLLTIHLAHVPYWFTGIQDWHYVFESSLIWCLLLGGTTSAMWEIARSRNRPLLQYWWLGMLTAPMLTMYMSAGEFWPIARVQNEVEGISFSRLRYQRFDQLLDRELGDRPALVLIQHDPTDLHIDYIDNRPPWDARVLRGRADEGPPDAEHLKELQEAFPDRQLWFYDVAEEKLEKLE